MFEEKDGRPRWAPDRPPFPFSLLRVPVSSVVNPPALFRGGDLLGLRQLVLGLAPPHLMAGELDHRGEDRDHDDREDDQLEVLLDDLAPAEPPAAEQE